MSPSLLNIIVGKIVEIKVHTEKLYVEQVDCGEGKPRTILSGLNGIIKLEDMQNKFVLVVGNLKPRKLQGIESEGMVLAASITDGGAALFELPKDVKPGQRVTFDGFPGEPELPHLNPKKKIFETIAPDLKTNAEGVVCWKDVPFKLGSSTIHCSLKNAVVK